MLPLLSPPSFMINLQRNMFLRTRRNADTLMVSCSDGYTYGNCYSRWDTWGRWVALVVVVVGFILLAFLFSYVLIPSLQCLY
jgi:hypothetical protein